MCLPERLQRQTVHGPNTVSVDRLQCCWSTIQLGADPFGTSEMLLSAFIFTCILLYNCMGIEHTFLLTFWPSQDVLQDHCVLPDPKESLRKSKL